MKNQQALWKVFFSRWVILGGVLFGLILSGVFLALLLLLRGSQPAQGAVTAIINITPLPTETPKALPTATATPAATLPPTPLPGVISVGAYVQISGTGTDGLRLRETPGLDGRVRFVGIEAEVFLVQDGPREADGYTWWLLVAPYDENVRGWAVANYLAVIQNP